jgi:ribosomal protein L3
MKALIARKVGMTSTVSEDGALQAVTLLSATPNVISQIKDTEKDGYQAVQVGFEEAKKQNTATGAAPKRPARSAKPSRRMCLYIMSTSSSDICSASRSPERIVPHAVLYATRDRGLRERERSSTVSSSAVI